MFSLSFVEPGAKLTTSPPIPQPRDAGPYVPPDPADAAALAELAGAFDAPVPAEPRLPLADWIDVQASLIRLQGGEAALWLAAKVDELAADVRALHASNPDDFDDRVATLERDR